MSLRDRVPVEPLDDERVARIERALVAALPARAPRSAPWRALVPLTVAALAVIALAWWRTGRAPATTDPAAPLEISAAAEGARVDIGDAVIVAGAGATFTVTRPDGGVDVVLAHGRIELDVVSRKGKPPLLVHADDVEVVVVGTRFVVERDDEVSVTVSEGVVRVRRDGESSTVAAGQAWSGPSRIALVDPPATGSGDDRAPGVGIGSGDDGSSLILRDRVAVAPPTTDDGESEVAGSGSGKRPSKRPKDKPIEPIADDPVGELRRDIKAQAIAAAVAVEGDALEAYEDLAVKKGAEGAQGLYGMARVQYTNGKNSDALRSLERYLQRFPSGAETEAVLWLRLRILCVKKLDDACRSAAHTYLTRVGGETARARIAERITATP